MNKYVERLYNGIWKENPIFVQMLGLCPTLAVTTSAINGVGMGLSTTAVLIAANFLIALLRKIIPDGVRLPAEIVVVASFVTIVDMLMEGFVPSLYASLGLYIPLIVVNCIILGRAEAYAMKNGPILVSVWDLDLQLLWHSSVLSVSFWVQVLSLVSRLCRLPISRSQSSSWRRVHSSYWLA